MTSVIIRRYSILPMIVEFDYIKTRPFYRNSHLTPRLGCTNMSGGFFYTDCFY